MNNEMAAISSTTAGPSKEGHLALSRTAQVVDATRESKYSTEDADTCRICRGESTAADQLYFPCKCSGTIKYVHQDCLMEWLSHSRKKYCELCKTQFRFTKLYDPHMPKELPLFVFIREAIFQTTSYILLWCRAALVLCVWLFCLPYCMRSMWRTLFWVGDGEWASRMKNSIQGAVNAAHSAHGSGLINSTFPITALQANTTYGSISAYGPLNYQLSVLARYLGVMRFRIRSPIILMLLNKLFSIFALDIESAVRSVSLNDSLPDPLSQPLLPSSLLSEAKVFRSLSSWPIIQKLAVDVVEGQILTLLVVLAFTLIFLIREWVVQQQPLLNLGVADMANGNIDPPALEAEANQGLQNAVVGRRRDEMEIHNNNMIPGNENDIRFVDNQNVTYLNRDKQLEIVGDSGQSDITGERKANKIWSQLIFDLYWLRRIVETVNVLPVEVRSLLTGQRDALAAENLNALKLEEQIKISAKLKDLKTFLIIIRGFNVGKDDIDSDTPLEILYRQYFTKEEKRILERNNPETYSYARIDEKVKTISNLREEMKPYLLASDDETGHSTSVKRSIFLISQILSYIDPTRRERSMDGIWATEMILALESESLDKAAELQNNGKGKAKADLANIDTDVVETEALMEASSHVEHNSDIEESGLQKSVSKAIDFGTGSSTDNCKERLNQMGEDRPRTAVANSHVLVASEVANDSMIRHHEAGESDMSSRVDFARNEITNGQSKSWLSWIVECFWGDIIPTPPDESFIERPDEEEGEVQQIIVEAMGIDNPTESDNNENFEEEEEGEEVVEEAGADINAAPEANVRVNLQDVPDDGEDLEGLLELIGAHGPITGLFQNAIVSAILVTSAITCAVWFPYLWGKVFLVFLGNPFTLLIKMPIRFLLATSDFIADFSLLVGGNVIYWIARLIRYGLNPLSAIIPLSQFFRHIDVFAGTLESVAYSALHRLIRGFAAAFSSPDADMLFLSINAHMTLRNMQKIIPRNTSLATSVIWRACSFMPYFGIKGMLANASINIHHIMNIARQLLRNLPAISSDAFKWLWTSELILLDSSKSMFGPKANTENPNWTAMDRVLVILAGYSFFVVLGALYLKYGKPLSSSANGRRVERMLSDILQQAGGVMKVILIISIEMIIFPLYCGLLLDIALLPLFEDATIQSRASFILKTPWKAGFIHWFIGTCYMYHFALFVSMCRKLMRSGVLYFIRDPDDPNFHPVRDVLERSVAIQLRKITFSALVYGAMIIVSLGGVVWSLYRVFNNLLPIRWTNEPLFEFSVDILLYCFLTPFLLKYVHISDLVHAMFKWWFQGCARTLRLSHFLFGERRLDEEGHYVDHSHQLAITRKDLDSELNCDRREPPSTNYKKDNMKFQRNGRFVFAPATDQVRIPKGSRIFVEVDGVDSILLDSFNTVNDSDGNESTKAMKKMVVYIPPNFAARIALFICSIWLFAAGLGLIVTVIPLTTGRFIFSAATLKSTPVNDIYAYSLGIYLLGGMMLVANKVRMASQTIEFQDMTSRVHINGGLQHLKNLTNRVASFAYVYGFLMLSFFFLLSLFIEFYIIAPIHTIYRPSEPHTVHIIQNWTLGFLYGRIIIQNLFQNPDSRPSRVLHAITGSNYTHPNIWLATRYFALPVALAFNIAFVLPYLLSLLTTSIFFTEREDRVKVMVHRMAYPAILLVILAVWLFFASKRAIGRWRMRIRDEVYLVGERLHNYGAKKARPGPLAKTVKR